MIDLTLQREANLLPIIRRFVFDLCNKVGGDPETASRVALATHELVENGIRYGQGPTVRLVVVLDVPAPRPRFTLEVSTRTSTEHLVRLDTWFREKRAAGEGLAWYNQRIRASAREEEGSGLGLARLAGEAGMELDYRVRGFEVTIVARSTELRSTG